MHKKAWAVIIQIVHTYRLYETFLIRDNYEVNLTWCWKTDISNYLVFVRYEPQVVGCPLTEEKDFLLVAQRTKIVRVDLRATDKVDYFPLDKTVIKNAIALEYDMDEDCLFYGDIVMDKIFMHCNRNSSTVAIVQDNDDRQPEVVPPKNREEAGHYPTPD